MERICPKCVMKGYLNIHLKETGSGEFVCMTNPKHKFKLDNRGRLISI